MPKSSISTSWTDTSSPARVRTGGGGLAAAVHRPHLHGHLMVDAPEAFFDELAEAGLDVVSFHHEAVGDPIREHVVAFEDAGVADRPPASE